MELIEDWSSHLLRKFCWEKKEVLVVQGGRSKSFQSKFYFQSIESFAIHFVLLKMATLTRFLIDN